MEIPLICNIGPEAVFLGGIRRVHCAHYARPRKTISGPIFGLPIKKLLINLPQKHNNTRANTLMYIFMYIFMYIHIEISDFMSINSSFCQVRGHTGRPYSETIRYCYHDQGLYSPKTISAGHSVFHRVPPKHVLHTIFKKR